MLNNYQSNGFSKEDFSTLNLPEFIGQEPLQPTVSPETLGAFATASTQPTETYSFSLVDHDGQILHFPAQFDPTDPSKDLFKGADGLYVWRAKEDISESLEEVIDGED